ncbi:glycoside hydrolase family 128 protein [Hydnomerulius pinastri MD-312]|uniref:Glycoside hydrolase family 128 protein n=1 Tax=Hydnomerulius pinastri MD-312 TaxID=994086 RepID=A0A0C9V1V9_9AGAM|nr:glycoside hydrolase family 128 protein [Hydnomerulius pinastri MD-312]
MLWGWNQVDDFKRLVVQGYATHVLGMNEPNEPSQSNMSPQDGASLWKQYIDPLKYQEYYLISPACTNDQAGLDWMKNFVQACDGCTIDAVAFHFYGTDPASFIEHATILHNMYNKPIWVTEFADQNFSGIGGQASMDEIYAFQSAVVAFVENTPWIEAAFPFGVMYDLQGVNEGNALLAGDGLPTALGYNYFG